jgi:putative intracellular protease/amidase
MVSLTADTLSITSRCSFFSQVKVVIVCTNADQLKSHKTGLWLEEAAVPYYLFRAKGYQVVMASPNGGPCPVDQASLSGDFYTPDVKKFMEDEEALKKLDTTIKLRDVDFSTADAIYLTGGHGTCVDFIKDARLKRGIELLYKSNKVVAAVCHGSLGLVQCVKPDDTPLVAGKTVTGFSDSEEAAAGLVEIVPFLLETKFREQGANYESAADWAVKVCVDGKLVTGQNPASSHACAEAVALLLG